MTSSDRRTYGQYCGTARALDVLGERWTLLIVRDLLPGPRRYGQLSTRLPGIATDILTSRLRTLEEHGLVARRQEAGVGRPVSYRLTEAGQELRPIIEQLAEIGARWLEAPRRSDAHFDLGWALGAAAADLHPADVPATPFVVSCPGQGYVLEALADCVELRYLEEPVANAAVMSGEADITLAALTGHVALDDADLDIEGDSAAAVTWVRAVTAAIPTSIRGPQAGDAT